MPPISATFWKPPQRIFARRAIALRAAARPAPSGVAVAEQSSTRAHRRRWPPAAPLVRWRRSRREATPSATRTAIAITDIVAAAEQHEVGRRPQGHVLAEDPVPDVVERQRQEAEAGAAEQQHAADRHVPALADPDPAGAGVLLAGEPEAEDARGEGAEEAEQHRVVAGVAERPVVAAVIDVVADVPEAAAHRQQQRDGGDEDRQRDPCRGRKTQRGRGGGARENLGAPRRWARTSQTSAAVPPQ